jgi:hypothetical protein
MALHFVFQFNVQHMFGELLVATKGFRLNGFSLLNLQFWQSEHCKLWQEHND